ncbi:short-chain dehydrogenase [Tersicoccus solisilvae]|uniref:Short-chain dehydrogenase n=1 Tax=Tersicoccus solisilvae TaxID=1882339 RepID=A0ABQ1NR46_9MICC|nr:SDR family oxidoreductase [Tersicoccus solisilvae]GGC78002.1 short-chain dehydrogenase [Tersicoccus solisilvae]
MSESPTASTPGSGASPGPDGRRTVVITGASDGIGAAMARSLAAAGDRVVVVGRSPEKTRAVAAEIDAPFLLADFADLAQVDQLATRLADEYPRIDVLVNNAGAVFGRRQTTGDGHEMTFQVDHLAPFLLTTRLLPVLTAGRARVITTSSGANLWGHIDIEDLDKERGRYRSQRTYGSAKLANILFTRELHRRHHGDGIAATAFHPGGVATNFSVESGSWFRFVYGPLFNRVLLTPAQGADTGVWLATEPEGDWAPGGYYARRKPARVNPQANDVVLAQQLWNRSATLVARV